MLLTQVSPGCKGDPARRSPVCPSLVGANNKQLYTETLPGLCPQPQKKEEKKTSTGFLSGSKAIT